MTMKIRVRYFASIREALGAGESLEVGPGTTLAALRGLLSAQSLAHSRVLGGQRPVRAAVDQRMQDEALVIVQDCEVAFFPPVTGG